MANFQNTYRSFTRIAVPYFRSDDKWPGRILLLTVIGLQLFQVWLNVRFNAWYNTFYTALQDKDWNTFIWQIGVFSVLAAFFIVSAVYQLYLQQWLQIRWRNWLTQRYLGRWLGQGTHYRMRLKGDQADNPDQRIADDIRQFIDSTLDIGIALLGSIVTLVSFVVILWTLSSATPLMIGSQSYNVPGYLVWAALIYAVLGTWITHLVGRPLVQLNFDQQRYEADFRFSLVRLRENAEEVTLLAGEPAEEARLRDRFSLGDPQLVRHHAPAQAADLPHRRLLAGRHHLPVPGGEPGLFLRLDDAWRVDADLVRLRPGAERAVVLRHGIYQHRRLEGGAEPAGRVRRFDRLGGGARRDRATGRGRRRRRPGNFSADDLAVGLPNGRRDRAADGFSIEPGERVLVTGPSGSGKTSLFRALGGVWPFGDGAVRIPKGANVLVLPQRPYLPLGTLRGALAYPGPETSFTHARDRRGGRRGRACAVARPARRDRLLGRQAVRRRAAAAVDRARAAAKARTGCSSTRRPAALDEASEAASLPPAARPAAGSAIVSIGHRSSLVQFHGRFFALKPEAPGRHRLAEPRRATSRRMSGT